MNITKQEDFYNWSIKIVEKLDNKEKIHTENIQEKTFPLKKIKNSLEKIFKKVYLVTFSGKEATEESKRTFFICLK
ncbi:MAG: hypothetical protein WCO18_01750, partial [bacterium]